MTSSPLNREACERRVYRLAALLTGNPLAATKVIAQVVDSQPDLGQLDSAHMDRLTVLRSREIAPSTLVSDVVSTQVAEAVSSLSLQQREAWVLARVYASPMREMSRAMDCSTSAAERHLQQADASLAARLPIDGVKTAAREMLRYSMSLDVPTFYRRARIRRKRVRLIVVLGVIAAIALALAALFIWWTRPFEGEGAERRATTRGI